MARAVLCQQDGAWTLREYAALTEAFSVNSIQAALNLINIYEE